MLRSTGGFLILLGLVVGIFTSLFASAATNPAGMDQTWWATFLSQLAAILVGVLVTLGAMEWLILPQLQQVASHNAALAGENAYPYDLLKQAKLGNTDAFELLKQQNLLRGQQLNKARWDDMNLAGQDLQNTDLEQAMLNRAILQEANLGSANLSHAMLEGSNLRNALLVETDLRWANMPKAALTRANLESALLYEANLQGANLRWAFLSRSDMRGANLREVDLHAATMEDTDLHAAKMQAARLPRANLQRARLQEANLENASLVGADLRGANLSWAVLVDADLSSCIFDNNTILPDTKRWRENTDMERFTNPAHHNFWTPR